MYVQFEFTQADLVDVAKRSLNSSKSVRRRMRNEAILNGLLVGAGSFLALQNLQSKWLLISISLISAGLMILLYPLLHKNAVDKRLNQAAAELMSEPGPYLCEIELRSEGLWVRQLNKQIIYEWKWVKSIEEAGAAVMVIGQDCSVAIRNRAFNTSDERNRFIELARSHLKEPRSL